MLRSLDDVRLRAEPASELPESLHRAVLIPRPRHEQGRIRHTAQEVEISHPEGRRHEREGGNGLPGGDHPGRDPRAERVPVDPPTPRKLKRRVATFSPWATSTTRTTTGLSMSPPYRG